MGKPLGLSVKAVVMDGEGRCLLVRRSGVNRSYVGQWEWPGGKTDPGEDFAEALRREVREETGLEVELGRLVGATEFEMPKVRVVVLCLEARVTGGALALSEEHDAAEWVPLRDLADRDLTGHVRSFMLDYAARRLAEGGEGLR